MIYRRRVSALSAFLIPSLFCVATCLSAQDPPSSSATEEKGAAQPFAVDKSDTIKLRLKALPALPVNAQGAFVGSAKGALIVAGGVDEVPREGDLADAKFRDSIFFLDGTSQWARSEVRLATPAAFGCAVPCEGGLLLLGGWTPAGANAKAAFISYKKPPNAARGDVTVTDNSPDYPPLPEALVLPSAKLMDGRVYVVGGCGALPAPARLSNKVYVLELTKRDPKKPASEQKPRAWEEMKFVNPDGAQVDPFGQGIVLPTIEVRKDEFAYKNGLYIFGGWQTGKTAGEYEYRSACWRYVPGSKSRNGWIRMADLPDGLQLYSALGVGPSHLVIHAQQGAPATRTLHSLLAGPAGNSVYLYHTYTATWVEQANDSGARAGQFVPMDGGIGWLDTGTRPTTVWKSNLEYAAKRFGTVDFVVIGLYLAGMIAIGEFFRRREKSTEDYFMGGRKIPWWAAGLSIWATGVSAISYMAIPAKTYAFDWSYISLGIWPVITTIIVAYVFIPMLRRLQIVTIMEYMEMRFDKSIRTAATVLMVVGQIGGRMSTVLLLPSLALSAVTGWDVYWCIMAMGVVTTIYTVTGGMSAVVWTDVAQTVVMFGGAILSFVLVASNVDGGLGSVVQVALDEHKLRMFDFAWDFSIASFWVFLLWTAVDIWGKLGQEGLQRAFSTKDVSGARRSMITCALVSIPGTLLFYGIGTALFAFYHQHPDHLNPSLPTDGIFPLFIMQQLPMGVAGLVIAGIFAAAMSTLSGMNSVATVVVKDYYAFFKSRTPDARQLVTAKWVTLACGVIATAGACYMASWKVSSLWDTFSKVMGLIGGGFGCALVLGLLTRRVNTFGVWVGTVAGSILLYSIEYFHWPVSFFIYGTVATVVGCAFAYAASLIRPGKPKNLDGLTLWTLKAR